MTKKTNDELAAELTDCFARTDRPKITTVYAGNGWFHQTTFAGGGYRHKMRRRDVEASLRRFAERFQREEFQRDEAARKAAEK